MCSGLCLLAFMDHSYDVFKFMNYRWQRDGGQWQLKSCSAWLSLVLLDSEWSSQKQRWLHQSSIGLQLSLPTISTAPQSIQPPQSTSCNFPSWPQYSSRIAKCSVHVNCIPLDILSVLLYTLLVHIRMCSCTPGGLFWNHSPLHV